MDMCAVSNTPEDVLKSQFALTTGDTFALKAFCMKRDENGSREARIKELVNQIRLGKEGRTTKKDDGASKKELKFTVYN